MTEDPKVGNKLLKGEVVAEMLSLPVTTVYEHARTGLIPCVRIGRAVRFRKQDLEAFIEGGGQSLPGGWRQEVA